LGSLEWASAVGNQAVARLARQHTEEAAQELPGVEAENAAADGAGSSEGVLEQASGAAPDETAEAPPDGELAKGLAAVDDDAETLPE
jgi:hypothetical protein